MTSGDIIVPPGSDPRVTVLSSLVPTLIPILGGENLRFSCSGCVQGGRPFVNEQVEARNNAGKVEIVKCGNSNGMQHCSALSGFDLKCARCPHEGKDFPTMSAQIAALQKLPALLTIATGQVPIGDLGFVQPFQDKNGSGFTVIGPAK